MVCSFKFVQELGLDSTEARPELLLVVLERIKNALASNSIFWLPKCMDRKLGGKHAVGSLYAAFQYKMPVPKPCLKPLCHNNLPILKCQKDIIKYLQSENLDSKFLLICSP